MDPDPSLNNNYKIMDLNPITRALTFVEANLTESFEVIDCKIEAITLKRDICTNIYSELDKLSQDDLYRIWLTQKDESLGYSFIYQDGKRKCSLTKKGFNFSLPEFDETLNMFVLKQTEIALMDNNDLIINYLLKGTMPNHDDLDPSCFATLKGKTPKIIEINPNIKTNMSVA